MVHLHFSISNPYSKTKFDNLYNQHRLLTKNKTVEFEITKYSRLVNISLDWKMRTDHAGLRIELGAFNYSAAFNFYDNRHWNSKTDTWEVYV